MHVKSSHFVYHTIRVMYRCSRHIQTMKCISFAAELLLIVFFATDEIEGRVLINKYVKCMYNVETRAKLNFYEATYSINHVSYFMHFTVVEVD